MSYSIGQEKFKIVFQNDGFGTHYIADENDSIIKKLDSTYILTFQPETLGYFHVFIIEGQKGWCAIDAKEKILFKVYNTEIGTPSPDEIINGLIRIEKDSLIGFANHKGEIVIQPQYEIATSFENGYAIIGRGCENIPWGNNHFEHDCHHYTTVCSQHGYIDTEGTIITFGKFTFEEIKKMIKN